MTGVRFWLRGETSVDEHRAVLTPDGVRTLVAHGLPVTVEDSAHRAFPIDEYTAAGARSAPTGSWPAAPPGTVILGLKAPAGEPFALPHTHVFFGHAYKGQQGAGTLLRRFAEGGGTLLDLESLTDDAGRRVTAFGYWAGYVGAALAVLRARGALETPVRAGSRAGLDAALDRSRTGRPVRALVIGALGRCGRGATEALAVAGVTATAWDVAETRELDRSVILDHDVLINTVLSDRPAPPFLRQADLDHPGRRLSVISDVSCDVTSDCNLLPIYDRPTTWLEPVRTLRRDPVPLDLVALDNLPSLLPRESSTAFSADLVPLLRRIDEDGPVWRRARERFEAAVGAPATTWRAS